MTHPPFVSLAIIMVSCYSLVTGACAGLVCFLGLVILPLAVIPLEAILPILLYIGVVIGAQAFQATPREHAPAVVLALIPNIAAWGQVLVDGALNAAGTSAENVGMAALGGSGVVYRVMESLGGGAILAGMILGAVASGHTLHRPDDCIGLGRRGVGQHVAPSACTCLASEKV